MAEQKIIWYPAQEPSHRPEIGKPVLLEITEYGEKGYVVGYWTGVTGMGWTASTEFQIAKGDWNGAVIEDNFEQEEVTAWAYITGE